MKTYTRGFFLPKKREFCRKPSIHPFFNDFYDRKDSGDATILTANSMRKFTPAATTTRKYMADMPSAKPERAMVSLIKSARGYTAPY